MDCQLKQTAFAARRYATLTPRPPAYGLLTGAPARPVEPVRCEVGLGCPTQHADLFTQTTLPVCNPPKIQLLKSSPTKTVGPLPGALEANPVYIVRSETCARAEHATAFLCQLKQAVSCLKNR